MSSPRESKLILGCSCCGSSSSSKKSNSSSSSSSVSVCPQCLNCLAVSWSGLVSAEPGFSGTFYGTSYGSGDVLNGVGAFVANLSTTPPCLRYSFTAVNFSGTFFLDRSPAQLEITFLFGTTPNDKATYTKNDSSSCIIGTYTLTGRTQPSYALTWPATLEVFDLNVKYPPTWPSSMTFTVPSSAVVGVTSVTVPFFSYSGTEFGGPQLWTAQGSFISDPSTYATPNYIAQFQYSCISGWFVQYHSIATGIGKTATTSTNELARKFWPPSGTTVNLFADSGMTPLYFRGGATTVTVTY